MEILSSVPNSPLTPGGMLQNFTPSFPSTSIQNQIGSRVNDFSKLTPANLHYHALQQQVLQQQVNNQNIVQNLATNAMSSYPTMSPCSTKTNTSGYLSQSSNICNLNISGSSNSLEQLYAPYKPTIRINGNGINHFSQAENQIYVGTTSNNLSRRLGECVPPSFETENNLLTSNYHSVIINIDLQIPNIIKIY